MIREAIHTLSMGKNLDYYTTKQAMSEIMNGQATAAQISSFITALRLKGETVDEITACAEGMREVAKTITTPYEVLEIVGTGGDEVGSFNISTTSAFVVSGAGVKIAKHGNRSVSSKSGAADVLEKLGANIKITPEQSLEVLDKCGFCFLFAQTYHASMKYAAPIRKEIGIRTVFNILGPLTNPANAKLQLLGVYSDDLVEPLANVLLKLGLKRGIVVCGASKLDEATTTGTNYIAEINRDGKVKTYTLNPTEYGFAKSDLSELIGGTPEENAQITRDILSGKKDAKRDVVILNSALALYVAIENKTLEECISIAKETIDSGKALAKLDEYVALTNSFQEVL